MLAACQKSIIITWIPTTLRPLGGEGMSVLGKVLAILNVIAAFVFMLIAAFDWGQRQSWAYAVYRADLALDGLPLDENELDLKGQKRINRLTDKTYTSVMGEPDAAKEPKDKTQLAYVDTIRKALMAEINQAPNDEAKREKLISILAPTAKTLPEREALIDKINKESVPVLTGDQSPLANAFEAVTKNPPQELVPEQRRQAVAHLLLAVARTPADRQKVAAVVGQREYAGAVTRQAAALRAMIEEMTATLDRDKARYVNDYQQRIAHLEALERELKLRQADLASHKDFLAKHETLLKARLGDVHSLHEELEAARKQTAQALQSLAQEQRELFDAQHRVGKYVEANEALEKELVRKEAARP
jgi:hypothetical protein